MFEGLETSPAAPGDDQLGVVVQKEKQIIRLDKSSVGCLPRPVEPQDLASRRIDGEEPATVQMGQTEQRVANDHRVAQEHGDFLGFPDDIHDPLVFTSDRFERHHAPVMTAYYDRLTIEDWRDGLDKR